MTTDRFGDPWSGTNYNGFSGVGGAGGPGREEPLRMERPEPRRFEPHEYRQPAPRRRGVPRGMLLAGIGIAVLLGLLFGFLARPDIAGRADAPEPMEPVTTAAAEAAATPMPVEVLEPAPPETPAPSAPLEVLPAEMAEAAEARAPVRPPRPQPRPEPTARTQASEVAAAPVLPPIGRAPAPRAEPSFDCRYARSPSEQMVCGDAELAALDRRLDRAFQEAVQSGIPYRALRAEQDDWLAIREDAARRSPRAVESVYRQRIRELDALAEPLG